MPRSARPFAWILLASLTLAGTLGAGQQSAAPTGLIVGQVVDGLTARPLSGAIVTVYVRTSTSGQGGVLPAPRLPILTGTDGRFVFRD